MATKAAVKKGAPKKALPKKAATKVAKKVVRKTVQYYPNINYFSGYNIRRYKSSAGDSIISFGCGAVEVRRKDLIAWADVLANPAKNARLLEMLNNFTISRNRNINIPANTKPEVLRDMGEFLSTKDANLEIAVRLICQSSHYFPQSSLIKTTPDTFRGIAGKVAKTS